MPRRQSDRDRGLISLTIGRRFTLGKCRGIRNKYIHTCIINAEK